jgi:hypothetical protein
MNPKPPKDPSGAGTRSGIAGRVEAAMKAHAPAPRGRQMVIMLIAVIVLGALIWDFMGNSSASRAVRKDIVDGPNAVAPNAPQPPTLTLSEGASTTTLTPEAAAAVLASVPAQRRAALRTSLLEQLVKPATDAGAAGRMAFETAARFVDDAEPGARAVIARLALRASAALAHEGAAPGAILFLSRLPDRGGAGAVAELDEVIVDPERALHVRIAAAHIRPRADRPGALRALAEDPGTHPALREALQ